ncbi:MAG: response regulator transcription factor [Ktedonobacterales bacterium]
MRILIVDDDPSGSRLMQFLLTEQGYQVAMIDNAHGALALIEHQPPDLILLDVNLPQLNGFEIYQRLQQRDLDIPVIFVTAKDELEDKLQGLRMGADDYICKPFQPAELQARVEVVLRRYRKGKSTREMQRFRVGSLDIDVAELQVTVNGRAARQLTRTEMKLLLQLAQRPGQVLSREELMNNVWDDTGESNTVDVYIRRLRRKLEAEPSNPALIQSIRGIGYRLAAT